MVDEELTRLILLTEEDLDKFTNLVFSISGLFLLRTDFGQNGTKLIYLF